MSKMKAIQGVINGQQFELYFKDEADEVIAHNKHKRCLAMAQWCMDVECKTEKDADFFVRWEYRWLALAEEPTWAKFLQLIHKEAK